MALAPEWMNRPAKNKNKFATRTLKFRNDDGNGSLQASVNLEQS